MATKVATKENKEVKQATAHARDLHHSARKTRLVADLIRGKSASQAIVILQHLNKRAGTPMLKVVLSAIANAEHNLKLDKEFLKIAVITVDQGTVYNRFRAAGRGMARPRRKPTCHITVTVAEDAALQKKAKKSIFPVLSRRPKKTHVHAVGEETAQENAITETGEAPKKVRAPRAKKENGEEAKIKGSISAKRGIFNRRGGEK